MLPLAAAAMPTEGDVQRVGDTHGACPCSVATLCIGQAARVDFIIMPKKKAFADRRDSH